jgi:hypothetical protein
MLNRLCALLIMLASGSSVMALESFQPTIHIDYHCDSANLWVNTPTADSLVYYWQGTSCGDNMPMIDTTYKVLASGTYYLRVYTTASSTWLSTTCATAIINLSQYPVAPPIPTYSGGNLTLTDPPVNVLYYAQGNSCGELMTNPGTIFPISASGIYYFKSLDTMYKCWSPTCTDVNVIIVNALEYNKLNSKGISILPNPAVDKMTISLPELVNKTNLTIYDFSGRTVLYQSGIVNNEVIDLSKLKQGTYIARFNNSDIDQSLKLIISK